MSLKCVGNQLLQTAPSLLLRGASTASASFWIQVGPDNDVADAGGVEVFGDSGGTFSAVLSGAGSLVIGWSSNDGRSGGVSTCALALRPGTAYHVATTWQSGLQVYYLNGVRVGTDTKVGSLGVLKDVTPHAYRLGSDQAGVDVTLDQPTLWLGYALSAADVSNLLQRTTQPGGIAPASIALQWSLAGADGAAAQAGDPGLADASTNGLALSSIVGGAPTYVAGDLAYVASPTLTAVVAPSGRSIVLLAGDGTGLDSGITSITSPNAIVSIGFREPPHGDAFTLGFGAEATASIPVEEAQPTFYGLWTFPTTPGHSYDLAATFPTDYYAAPQYGYEVIDGGSVVVLTILTCTGAGVSGQAPIPGFNDPGVDYPDGTAVPWQSIASGVVASGSSLQVRFTAGPAGVGRMSMDAIRVQDATAGTITYYDDVLGPNFTASPGDRYSIISGVGYAFGGSYSQLGTTSGVGVGVSIQGGAPALQATLEAIASIGPGNVVVADLGGGSYQVSFVGLLAGTQVPTLTCADPHVLVARVNPDNAQPTLSINGGSPIMLTDWIWTEAAPTPYVLSPLPQSAPASQTFGIGNLPYFQSGTWDGQLPTAGSVSGSPVYGHSAGLTMGFGFEQLPPGTYQFAITYPSGPFSHYGDFQPYNAVAVSVVDGGGNTLASATVDLSQAPADYQTTEPLYWDVSGLDEGAVPTAAVGWKNVLSVTTTAARSTLSFVMSTAGIPAAAAGSPQAVAILDAIQFKRTSPDTSVVIGPDDVATIDIPGGWGTCQAGAIPATPALAVAPPSPSAILGEFSPSPKTLNVGWNVETDAYDNTFFYYSNLAYKANPIGADYDRDADDYPTRLYQGSAYTLMIGGSAIGTGEQFGDPWQGSYVINPGLYCVTWVGDADAVSIGPSYGGVAAVDVTSQYPRPSNVTNWKVYDVGFDGRLTARPALNLQYQSTTPDPSDSTGQIYLINVSAVQVYPPDPSDPTGQTIWGLDVVSGTWAKPPTFHPWAVEKLAGVQSLRFLDPLNVNTNPAGSLAQFKAVTHSNRCQPVTYGKAMTVSSIGPLTGTPFFAADNSTIALQIVTATPHGLYDGAILGFGGCGTAQYTGGSIVLDTPTSGAAGFVHVIDDVTLECRCGGGNGSAMTNTLSGGLVGAGNYGTFWPVEEMIELCQAVGAPKFYLNVPITMDPSPGGGAFQLAEKVAALLPAGMAVQVEVGNENWNNAFATWQWCYVNNSRMGSPDGTSFEAWAAVQVKAVHDRFVEAFAAAGRPGDLQRLVGAFAGYSAVAQGVLAQLQKLGASFEGMVVGPYFNSWPVANPGYTADQLPILDAMTPDHLLDYAELNAVYGGYEAAYFDGNRAAMLQYGYGDSWLGAYEWAPDYLVPTDPVGSQPPGTTPNYAARTIAVRRHPRMYGVILRKLQNYQDAGLAYANYFNAGAGSSYDSWDAWESGRQQPGTGDPVADAINTNAPWAKNQVLCEIGGAVNHWASLVPPATTTTTTTTSPRLIPGRNGRIRAVGFPRGTYRTTRAR